jgi:hypothetical protein
LHTDLGEMVAKVRNIVVRQETERHGFRGLDDARNVPLVLRDMPDDVRQVAVVCVPQ